MKEEDRKREAVAWRKGVATWVLQALRKTGRGQGGTVAVKLRAVSEATRHEYHTADIDVMLDELAARRNPE